MKFSVFALVLTAVLSSSSFAEEKCNRRCTSTGAASAAAMSAGYTALKGYINIRDIERRFLKDVFVYKSAMNFSGYDSHIRKIRPGDKVYIEYSKSSHLNVSNAKMEQLRQSYSKVTGEIAELNAQLEQAKKPKVFGFGAGKVDGDEVRKLESMIASRKQYADVINTEARAVSAASRVKHSPVTIILKNTNDNDVAYKLRELVDSGKSVYTVKRVPNSIMRKLARARNGYILAGTAVAIGLISAEEIYSGRIAVKREEELKKFN